jgi:hypothetical protein
MRSQRSANQLIVSVFALCFVLSGASPAEERAKPKKGYNCVLMGHSFFVPMARQLEEHAKRCGFKDHKQVVSGRGGSKGSPGSLWKNLPDKDKSREAIRSGSVNLVGLTFASSGSELADYKKWVDFALKHNPKTSFFIMAPSTRYQNKSFKEFEEGWKKVHATVHGLIVALRKDYPGTTFFCIPQGKVLVELWRLFDKGQLPEVSKLKSRNESCIFRDNIGHGGKVPIKMGTLLWLATIYKVDLKQYKWDTMVKTDLKAMAQKIAQDDPYTKH